MDLGLRGRTAIVCGASAGIGLGCAESLAEAGANVVMFARRRDVLEREAERLGGVAVAGDVTSADDLERLVSTAVERFGGVDVARAELRRPAADAERSTSPTSRSRAPRGCSCSRRSGSSASAARTSRRAATDA